MTAIVPGTVRVAHKIIRTADDHRHGRSSSPTDFLLLVLVPVPTAAACLELSLGGSSSPGTVRRTTSKVVPPDRFARPDAHLGLQGICT